MNRILEIDIENQRVVVEPGVITLDLKNVLAKYGYLYQPDPASEKVTTIGGNFGENAGGAPLPEIRGDQQPCPGGGAGPL